MHVIVCVTVIVVKAVAILAQDVKTYVILIVKVNATPYAKAHVKITVSLVAPHLAKTNVEMIVMLGVVTVLNKGDL